MYVQIFLIFQCFQKFVSIHPQNSVKILAKPYTWRLCRIKIYLIFEGTLNLLPTI